MKLFHNAVNIKKDPESEEPDAGDELCSDSFPLEILDGVVYKIKFCKRTDCTSGDFDIGANQSQEEAGESYEGSAETNLDCVLNHRLKPSVITNKKQLKLYVKEYFDALGKLMAEKYPKKDDEKTSEAETRLKKVKMIYKDIFSDFDNLEFYTGENFNNDGTLVVVHWDDVTPYGYVPVDGISEEKL